MASNKPNNDPWHVDFRFIDELPDTKTVRTDTALNIIFGLIVALLLLLVFAREANIRRVNGEVADLKAKTVQLEPTFKAAQESGKEFNAIAKNALDFPRFLDRPFGPDDLLVELMRQRAEDVQYGFVSIEESEFERQNKTSRAYNISLTGLVSDLTAISRLKEQIVKYPLFEGFSLRVEEQPARAEGANFRFAMNLRFDTDTPFFLSVRKGAEGTTETISR